MSQAVLVSYDIVHDRRRRKVRKALTRLGRRVQHSVFLIEHRSPDSIRQAIEPLIQRADDDVRIHPLCANCKTKTLLLGRARARAALPPGFTVV